jgi:protochlorophyllide reductase
LLQGLALSAFLAGHPAAAQTEQPPQTIVVTGANSGIGYEACARLAAQGHTIVLACRSLQKAQETATRLGDSSGGKLIPAECNLASLASIDAFAQQLPSLLGGDAKVDTLCLNAGLCRNVAATDVARTADGFELTGA